MSQKSTLRALLAAGVASALVAASATGALADETTPPETGPATEVADANTAEQDGNNEPAPEAPAEEPVADGNPEQEPDAEEGELEAEEGDDAGNAEELDEELKDKTEGDDAEDQTDDVVTDVIIKPELENEADGDLYAEAEWTVTKKTVKNVSKVTGAPGSKVPVTYQVDLSAIGVVSDVVVDGTLSVKNPNKTEQTYTLEAVLKNGVSEAKAVKIPNSVCTFDGKDADPNTPGHQVKVGAGAKLDFDYTCTSEGGWFGASALDSVPYNFWTFLRSITLGAGDEGIAEIATKVDTSHVDVHNSELDVYDVNLSDVDGDSVYLGSVAATDGKGQFQYVMNLTVPAQKCLDYVNAVYAVGDLVWVDEFEAELDVLTDQATVTACPETTKPAAQTVVSPAGAITADGSNELAKTGAESPMLGGIGAGLIGLGAVAMGLARRARKA